VLRGESFGSKVCFGRRGRVLRGDDEKQTYGSAKWNLSVRSKRTRPFWSFGLLATGAGVWK